MKGRTWSNVDIESASLIKNYLLENGGLEQPVKSPAESWRVRFSDSTFTYYSKGTLYSTPSNSQDPEVFAAWKYIDSKVGSQYALPTKDFLIGLDETGKGELIGHTILTGVIFPKELFHKIDALIGPADTKKRHKFEYWDEIFTQIDRLRQAGLDFVFEKIPPWHVDRYNLNKIMDVCYQRILSILFRKADISRCRIVLDDYNIGPTLGRFLNFLRKRGAEVIVSHNSEARFLEAKTASVISKRLREAVIKAINENEEFQIEGLSIGPGNANNAQTLEWLKRWHASGKPWPWFIKRSFKTIRRIEGKTEKAPKEIPPIRDDILAETFLDAFAKGQLSINSLALVCPFCGSILKSAAFAVYNEGKTRKSSLKCANPECERFIADAGPTLRYYCGYLIPDSSAIQRSIISNDLEASRFFEDFTIILTPVVRKECNGKPKAKREFERLRQYSARGRIKLENVGQVIEVADDLPNTVRDEMIIQYCLDYNAILVTGDKTMSTFAEGQGIFNIYV